ncbi:MAG: type I-U CRISPR-associated protein Cas7 [Hyphomicrobiales bacterium]|nr:type I-U CRISPR-associated protein Cas7 [Hyphomicrobiales bacterium]
MSNPSDMAARWLSADGPAALVRHDWLMPVMGWQSPIKPPTFAGTRRGEESRYAIDEYEDAGRTVRCAVVDTVGSQANRSEPAFKSEELKTLVPQITIAAGNHVVNLLDLGHRAADAIARYSGLRHDLQHAFDELLRSGDARPLATIAPTSLIFGAWDSRGNGVKLQRIVKSSIRAWDVIPLNTATQFNPLVPLGELGITDDSADELNAASELGLRHAPARKLDGVLVRGEIRRDAMLSLAGLRNIGPFGPEGDALRAYLLGLAMVVLAAPEAHDLREGCLLVRDQQRPSVTEVVSHDGSREKTDLSVAAAREYAAIAASAFGVGPDRDVRFDQDAGRAAITERTGGDQTVPRKRGRPRKQQAEDSTEQAEQE